MEYADLTHFAPRCLYSASPLNSGSWVCLLFNDECPALVQKGSFMGWLTSWHQGEGDLRNENYRNRVMGGNVILNKELICLKKKKKPKQPVSPGELSCFRHLDTAVVERSALWPMIWVTSNHLLDASFQRSPVRPPPSSKHALRRIQKGLPCAYSCICTSAVWDCFSRGITEQC